MAEVSMIESARQVLLKNNEMYLANSLLASVLQKNQYNEAMIFELGKSYLKSTSYESAQKCFSHLKEVLNTFEAHFFYARSCEGLGEMQLARESYLDALLLPTVDSELLFEAYKNIGNIYLREQNIDVAEDFYHKAYSLNASSAPLMVNLGTLELQKTDSSGAIERFRMALKIDQRFSPAWVGIALSYHLFGDFEMAWASILRAVECDSKNSTALLLMSQWSIKNNAIDQTLNALINYFDQGLFEAPLSLAFIELCIHSNNYYLARWELERALLWDPKNKDLLSFDKVLQQHGY